MLDPLAFALVNDTIRSVNGARAQNAHRWSGSARKLWTRATTRRRALGLAPAVAAR